MEVWTTCGGKGGGLGMGLVVEENICFASALVCS